MSLDAVSDIENWQFAVACAGGCPDVETCLELLRSAPLPAQETLEFRLIGQICRWRKMGITEECLLWRITAWLEVEDDGNAA